MLTIVFRIKILGMDMSSNTCKDSKKVKTR